MLCDTQDINVALLYIYLKTERNGWNFFLSYSVQGVIFLSSR